MSIEIIITVADAEEVCTIIDILENAESYGEIDFPMDIETVNKGEIE